MTVFPETSAYLSDAQVQRAPMPVPRTSADAIFLRPAQHRADMQVPAWRTTASQRLASLRHLKADWDGENSPPPSIEIIKSVNSFLENCVARIGGDLPIIEPTRVGGVLLSWQRGSDDLEVDFQVPDVATFVYLNHDSQEADSGILCSDDQPAAPDTLRYLELMQNHFLCQA
jgi:hypothetical protein